MITPVFPTLIHFFTVDDYYLIKDQLIEFVYEEQRKDPVGKVVSNIGGWQSKSYCENNILFTTIQETVSKYFSTNRIFSKNTLMNISSFWMNINKKGDHNEIHDHSMCDMAGVLYLKTSKDCGRIEFQSPNSFIQCKEMAWYNNELCEAYNFYPAYGWDVQESEIYIFPSSLLHKVHQNKTDNDRISVSFNIQLYLNK